MISSVENFKNYFNKFSDNYVVIGGFACDILMNKAGLDFRATKDIDIVLIVEALSNEFVKAFWNYVNKNGYKAEVRKNGEYEFYRFVNDNKNIYPNMIELFSRPQNHINLNPNGHLIPIIPDDDEISSLSAILLNEEYYNLLLIGKTKIDSIPLLDGPYLILFKIRAWIDLTNKKENGIDVRTRDIRKHMQDVFRLSQLLTGHERIEVSLFIKQDIDVFVKAMKENNYELASIGINQKKDEILRIIDTIYVLK